MEQLENEVRCVVDGEETNCRDQICKWGLLGDDLHSPPSKWKEMRRKMKEMKSTRCWSIKRESGGR